MIYSTAFRPLGSLCRSSTYDFDGYRGEGLVRSLSVAIVPNSDASDAAASTARAMRTERPTCGLLRPELAAQSVEPVSVSIGNVLGWCVHEFVQSEYFCEVE